MKSKEEHHRKNKPTDENFGRKKNKLSSHKEYAAKAQEYELMLDKIAVVREVMSEREKNYRNYLRLMNLRCNESNHAFHSCMSVISDVLSSIPECLKVDETQDRQLAQLEHHYTELMKHNRDLDKRLVILEHEVDNLIRRLREAEAITKYLTDLKQSKHLVEIHKEKLRSILNEIRILEKINEKEIMLVETREQKSTIEKQCQFTEEQINAIKDKNVRALHEVKKRLFAVQKVQESMAAGTNNIAREVFPGYDHQNELSNPESESLRLIEHGKGKQLDLKS